MKKNETLTCNELNWNIDGEPFCVEDKHKIILDRGVPGDEIVAKIIKPGFQTSFAKVTEVNKESPFRAKADLCQNKNCPGCALKLADYSFQVDWKKQQLDQAIGVSVDFKSDQSKYYRDKIILPATFNPVSKQYEAGLYQKNSHRIVPWNFECTVCLPQISQILQIVLADLNACFTESSQILSINQIFIRGSAQNGFQLGLIFTEEHEEIDRICTSIVAKTELVRSCFYEINPNNSNSVLIRNPVFVTADQTIDFMLNNRVYKVGAESFFQANLAASEMIVSTMNEALQGLTIQTVFDICSGIGVLSGCLSGDFQRFCFENNADSMKYLTEKDHLNSSFITVDMAKIDLSEYPQPDAIILDPPRKGVDASLLKMINLSNAKIILYLSCNPLTQKRDLAHLSNYSLTRVTGFDMFPQTPHIESLAILTKI